MVAAGLGCWLSRSLSRPSSPPFRSCLCCFLWRSEPSTKIAWSHWWPSSRGGWGWSLGPIWGVFFNSQSNGILAICIAICFRRLCRFQVIITEFSDTYEALQAGRVCEEAGVRLLCSVRSKLGFLVEAFVHVYKGPRNARDLACSTFPFASAVVLSRQVEEWEVYPDAPAEVCRMGEARLPRCALHHSAATESTAVPWQGFGVNRKERSDPLHNVVATLCCEETDLLQSPRSNCVALNPYHLAFLGDVLTLQPPSIFKRWDRAGARAGTRRMPWFRMALRGPEQKVVLWYEDVHTADFCKQQHPGC